MHAIPKQAAQAIRRAAEIDWKPTFFLANVSSSVGGVLKPAGLDNAVGLITAAWLKDPNDPQWANDSDYLEWVSFMKNSYPDGDRNDSNNVYGYIIAQTMTRVLEQCGDDLSAENIMKQVTNLDFATSMLLPGIKIKTSPTDYYPLKLMQLQRFDGKVWVKFDDVIGN
jgi:branched-chain amino acid transport system substrate-binding protein